MTNLRPPMTWATAGFALSCLLTACTTEAPARDPVWSEGPQADWYAGDFHVHTSVGSNDTRLPDGSLQSFPETIAVKAAEIGLDFLVLTDHSNSAGSVTWTTVEYGDRWNSGPEFPLWDTAAALSSASFLMVDGSEISPVSTLKADECIDCSTAGTGDLSPVGHVGCIPLDLETFDRTGAFRDRPPGDVNGDETVRQCHERGGFAIVNHPFVSGTPWMVFDWTTYDYDALEIWNGGVGWDLYDVMAYEGYLCDRLQGRHTVAVGGSDNHRTLLPYEDTVQLSSGPPLGLPMTSILSPSFTWTDLTAGLVAGRIVVHEKDTFVEFRIFDGAGAYVGTVGDRAAPGRVAEGAQVWIRGKAPLARDLQIHHVAPDSCVDPRTPGTLKAPEVETTVVYEEAVCAGDAPCDFERKVRLDLQPGLYFAVVGPFRTAGINARDLAITNVFTVGAE